MAKILIVLGLCLVLAGSVLYYYPQAFHWMGRLPGDVTHKEGNVEIYFPWVTCLVASIVLSLLLWIVRRFL